MRALCRVREFERRHRRQKVISDRVDEEEISSRCSVVTQLLGDSFPKKPPRRGDFHASPSFVTPAMPHPKNGALPPRRYNPDTSESPIRYMNNRPRRMRGGGEFRRGADEYISVDVSNHSLITISIHYFHNTKASWGRWPSGEKKASPPDSRPILRCGIGERKKKKN